MRNTVTKSPYNIKETTGIFYLYGQQLQVQMYEVYADYSTKIRKYKEQHVCKCLNKNNAELIKAILEKELFSVPCYAPLDDEDRHEMDTMHLSIEDVRKLAEFDTNISQLIVQTPEKPKRTRKTSTKKKSEPVSDL